MWRGASGKTVYHTLIVCHKVKVTAGLKLDKKSFADLSLSLQMMWGGASAQTVYTSHLSRSSTTAEVATILFHQQQKPHFCHHHHHHALKNSCFCFLLSPTYALNWFTLVFLIVRISKVSNILEFQKTRKLAKNMWVFLLRELVAGSMKRCRSHPTSHVWQANLSPLLFWAVCPFSIV